MKNLIYIILVCVACISCSFEDQYAQLVVRDASGRYYLLKHNIGDTYFIDDLSEMNEKLLEF